MLNGLKEIKQWLTVFNSWKEIKQINRFERFKQPSKEKKLE